MQQPPPDLVEAFAANFRRVAPDTPASFSPTQPALEAYQMLFRRAAEGIQEVGCFGPIEHWQYDWDQKYSKDEWLDQLRTSGALTQLDSEVVAEVLQGVGAAIDVRGGSLTVQFAAVVITAARTRSSSRAPGGRVAGRFALSLPPRTGSPESTVGPRSSRLCGSGRAGATPTANAQVWSAGRTRSGGTGTVSGNSRCSAGSRSQKRS